MPTLIRFSVDFKLHLAVHAKGLVILRHLVRFRQVGVKVIFAVELANGRNFAAEGKTGPNGILHRFLIQNRQRPGQPQTNGAYVRVLFVAELRTAAAPNFRVSKEALRGFPNQ